MQRRRFVIVSAKLINYEEGEEDTYSDNEGAERKCTAAQKG